MQGWQGHQDENNEVGLRILIREVKKNEFGIWILIKIGFHPKNPDD